MLKKFTIIIFLVLLGFFACEDKSDPEFEILFEPIEVNFDKVETNQIVSQKIRIKNTDNSSETFTGEISIEESNNFTMDFKGVLTLNKNESKEIYITFRPINNEKYTGKLVVKNDYTFNEMYLYGEGASPVSFTFTPGKINFGLVKEGEHKDSDININNSSYSGFDLEISYSIVSSEFLIVDGSSSAVLAPGTSKLIAVRYSPSSVSNNSKITINHNSSVQTNPLVIGLSGIMDKTVEINSLISEGWDEFESTNYIRSTLKFQQAMNFAEKHSSYDSLYGEAMLGRGWGFLFNRQFINGHYDFSKTLSDFGTDVSSNAKLDALAGKAIAGKLINDYASSIAAALELLDSKPAYQFSHKLSIDYKDVRMALIQSYYNSGQFVKSALEMDKLNPVNAPHSSGPATLLAAIQALSGSI